MTIPGFETLAAVVGRHRLAASAMARPACGVTEILAMVILFLILSWKQTGCNY
jgi:hypothetical protein